MSVEAKRLNGTNRGLRLFDRVDYRVAETPEEKNAVYARRMLFGGVTSRSTVGHPRPGTVSEFTEALAG